MPVLTDDTQLARTRREGLVVAIDLGTTTVVAQLLDLASGKLLGLRTGLNPQTIQGADVMSRVRFAVDSNDLTVADSRLPGHHGSRGRRPGGKTKSWKSSWSAIPSCITCFADSMSSR